jgi:sugar phosphate isomerase/epimerase
LPDQAECERERVLKYLLVIAVSLSLVLCVAVRAGKADHFRRDNLVAWCIVPFDARKRTPEQRAEMLQRLGIKHFAYDWRDEHVPTFDAEMDELKKRDIELTAVWFPAALNDQARVLLDGIRKHHLKPQLWVTCSAENVDAGVATITPIAREAEKLGCKVALYNHGGWFGEPENQLAIIERLKAAGVTNVGIVYNLHHGHAHVDRFKELLEKMKPHLLALNLNGMTRDGAANGKKILPIGEGELDLPLLKVIQASGYEGPIGILNHTDEDAETRLKQNIEGLESLVKQLNP